MSPRPKTKILLDGGDQDETKRIKDLIGFIDGQTTNPSLIAKNPEVQEMVASGHKMTELQENEEYKKIVSLISPLVGEAGVSIEVFSDLQTTAEHMLKQGREMFSWIPNAYVKYPATREGLKAAQASVEEGIRVNITLCFSQEQAAAVYAATKGTSAPVYVSPFVGRLDDRGDSGMDLIKNIQKMYAKGDGHVKILAASIRSLDHLMYCFALGVDLATVPAKVLEEWASKGMLVPDEGYIYQKASELKPITYKDLDLDKSWESYDLNHELTVKGIEKFVADYKATLYGL